jgi:DNA repair protein RadA/Sms
MSKTKLEFVCRECGSAHPQWAGQCLECQAWNTLEEMVVSKVFLVLFYWIRVICQDLP